MSDPVSKPAHYTFSRIEVIEAIEAWGLGFCLGNVVKYVARAGRKDPARTVEDLKKARWYLEREIERRTENDTRPADGTVRKPWRKSPHLAGVLFNTEWQELPPEVTGPEDPALPDWAKRGFPHLYDYRRDL